MLTWAMVYLSIHSKIEWNSTLPFGTAMLCDVAIFYFIASAFAGKTL